jgi:hypothetical protein
MNQTRASLLFETGKTEPSSLVNQTLVLLILTAVRDTTDTRQWSFSSGQATSGQRISKNNGNPRG